MKKKQVKRTLVFDYETSNIGGTDRKEIGKAVEIDITNPTRSFMFIELMKDGKWRLTWSKNFLPPGQEMFYLNNIKIERTND